MDSLLADTLHQNHLVRRKNTGNPEGIKHTDYICTQWRNRHASFTLVGELSSLREDSSDIES